ncbi:GNAT family N-acetyltransferase [Streptomyces sp. CA-132043]|uniref:GNAT family N-acetyltransferase n=1 Tax=Streptomyces sp. CA-132043 TaxID=3240048 RepID=UPI003D8E1418
MTGTSHHPHEDEPPTDSPTDAPAEAPSGVPPEAPAEIPAEAPALEPLSALLTETDGRLPDPLLDELTDLYASNAEFFALSGDFPDPYALRRDEVASSLNAELAHPAAEVLLAREPGRATTPASGRVTTPGSGDRPPGRLTGLAATLTEHPDPIDPYPWIGLLLIHGDLHRSGHGSRLAACVEDRLRASGHDGVRLAVLDNNPGALVFWTALGYRAIDHRTDHAMGRPCTVLHKDLSTGPDKAKAGRP